MPGLRADDAAAPGRPPDQPQAARRALPRVGGGARRPGADPPPVACWLPLRQGLTPHGLRHGHQTWLDLGIRYVLQSERMGHEVLGMRGVYAHVTHAVLADLRDGLQGLWEASLAARRELAILLPESDIGMAKLRSPVLTGASELLVHMG